MLVTDPNWLALKVHSLPSRDFATTMPACAKGVELE